MIDIFFDMEFRETVDEALEFLTQGLGKIGLIQLVPAGLEQEDLGRQISPAAFSFDNDLSEIAQSGYTPITVLETP
jgi:hypothetical protein